MKVFNLTDMATPELQARGLVNQPLVVGSALVPPGGEVEVADTEILRRDLVCFTGVGALSVGARPPEYLVAKAKRESDERLASLERAALNRRKEG